MKRKEAFEYLAKQLTAEGIGALKNGDATEVVEFKSATIKRWYYAAQPKAAEEIRNGADNADARQVAVLISKFVARAFSDKMQLPPGKAYTMDVIRETMRNASFRSLTPKSGA